jgi:predicted signal transduction protein with EAL and GGDEF domain
LRSLVHRVGDDQVITVTASIGCALIGDNKTFDSLDTFVAAADQSLYAAKNAGRDRYVVYQPLSRAGEDETIAAASAATTRPTNLIVD